MQHQYNYSTLRTGVVLRCTIEGAYGVARLLKPHNNSLPVSLYVSIQSKRISFFLLDSFLFARHKSLIEGLLESRLRFECKVTAIYCYSTSGLLFYQLTSI